MTYIEPTLVEAKINTMEQKTAQKSGKTYMLVNFSGELRASAWDQMLWPILMNAQTHDATLQVWYIRNNMGYNTITNLQSLPGAAGGSVPGNGGGGEHFIKGAGDQQTPPPPAPRSTPSPARPAAAPSAPSKISHGDRVQLCLAVSNMAYSGMVVKSQEDFYRWLRTLERYVAENLLPDGHDAVVPAQDPPLPDWEDRDYNKG